MTPHVYEKTDGFVCDDYSLLCAHYACGAGRVLFRRKNPPYSGGEWLPFQGSDTLFMNKDVDYVILYPIRFSSIVQKHHLWETYKGSIKKMAMEICFSDKKVENISCHSLPFVSSVAEKQYKDIIKEWSHLTNCGFNGLDDVPIMVAEFVASIKKDQFKTEAVNKTKLIAYSSITMSNFECIKDQIPNIRYENDNLVIPVDVMETIWDRLNVKKECNPLMLQAMVEW